MQQLLQVINNPRLVIIFNEGHQLYTKTTSKDRYNNFNSNIGPVPIKDIQYHLVPNQTLKNKNKLVPPTSKLTQLS